MSVIASIVGRVIHDSRGLDTVEVTVTDDAGRLATVSLPSGSSVGRYEAHVLDAASTVNLINTVIAPALLRMPLDSQQTIDERLQAFDPSVTKDNIGVNTTLGVSLAVARLLATQQGQPLYRSLQRLNSIESLSLPTPMFNLINGGVHAKNNLDFQEYMIVPLGLPTFYEKLQAGRKIFAVLGDLLQKQGHDTSIGYEGGYAPNLSTNEEGLGYLTQAITTAGYQVGVDVWLGLDIAASAIANSFGFTVESYQALLQNFPLISLEDPFTEDDVNSWAALKQSIDQNATPQKSVYLVGDDLFVGNKDRLLQGVTYGLANAILIKINQAGTLTEIVDCIRLARQYKLTHILSHRSGETLDSFISDLAVGSGAQFIKAGSPSDEAPERMVKYERLAEIEEELKAGDQHAA